MKRYIVYNDAGQILRTGGCPDKCFLLQAGDGEFVMEGSADDLTQKVINPGIAAVVVNKTTEEIEAERPPEIPFEKRAAHITSEQWKDVLSRLENLENRA